MELDGLVSVTFDADDFDALRAALVSEGEIDHADEWRVDPRRVRGRRRRSGRCVT